MKKTITNLEIHKSVRNLEVVGTWGKAKTFKNAKRQAKADKAGRKAKHKNRHED